MIGYQVPQECMFTADQQYLQYVGEDTFYGFLAKHRHRLFRDEDFAMLYCPDNGRPSVAPSLLATALLLQAHDKSTDAEARDKARYDLRWKVALGLEVDESPFAKSTLQTFRSQLIIHDKVAEIFKTSLSEARIRGIIGGKRKLKLALDTTPIFGKGAVKDTYNLLADGIRQLAGVLARILDRPMEEWVSDHDLGRYFGSSIKGESDVDWSDDESKRTFLSSIVEDAARLLVIASTVRGGIEAGSSDDRAIVESSELLRTLLLQDVNRRSDGDFEIKHGTSQGRIVSVHDPEMRAGHKSKRSSFEGHKASVAVETESGLITEVDVLAGNESDNTGALTMVERSEANTGCAVERTITDCAYGDGETRRMFADEGRELVARVPRRPNKKTFPKEDFVIDLEAQRVTCPACQTTSTWHWRRINGKRVKQFVFAAAVCDRCPLKSRCTTNKRSSHGRTVVLHPEEELLQQARAYQRTDAFGEDTRRRQVVEHRIARLVQLGIRTSRFFGRLRTKFQLIMAATVANFTLIIGMNSAVEPISL